jgi:hypothetical protein
MSNFRIKIIGIRIKCKKCEYIKWLNHATNAEAVTDS